MPFSRGRENSAILTTIKKKGPAVQDQKKGKEEKRPDQMPVGRKKTGNSCSSSHGG